MSCVRTAALTAFIIVSFPWTAPAASLKEANRLYFSGQPEQALQAYRSILNTKPSVDAALNAATVAQELGRHKEAIAILEQARKSRLGGPGLVLQLAWARLNEGQVETAQKLFDEAASSIAGTTGETIEPVAALGRAMALLEGGKPVAATSKLRSLVMDEPRFALAHFLLGRALEKTKDYSASARAYEEAVKVDSHFVEARLPLGALYERLRRPDDAWRQFARLNQVFRSQTVASALDRLSTRITKKPEEIIPPRRIASHSTVPSIGGSSTFMEVRVGIGTDAGGAPTPKKILSFRTSHDFSIVEVKTSSEIVRGRPREPWTIRLNSDGSADIFDSQGEVRGQFRDQIRIRLSDRDRGTTIINTLTFAPGNVWGGMSDREFRGEFEVVASKRLRRLIVINVVSIEEYLYGVLAAEMPVAWPLEALKAQAVMARNVGVLRTRSLHLHKKYGYNLCDEQHCQVYAGVGVENQKVRTAVDATRGRILTYDGAICHTVFSSNCGGMTQRGAQAGWGDVAYWKSISEAKGEALPGSPWEWKRWVQQQPDLYCQASQYVASGEYRWVRLVPATVIAEKLARKRRLGRVRQIHIAKRASSGRVQRVRIIGTKQELNLSKEHEIRKFLGLGSLRSTMFSVDTVVRDGKAHSFIFYGAGWGHGVGFCQSGAAGRADGGATYEQILSAYFPGSTLR